MFEIGDIAVVREGIVPGSTSSDGVYFAPIMGSIGSIIICSRVKTRMGKTAYMCEGGWAWSKEWLRPADTDKTSDWFKSVTGVK
jgi:hypothetical protein